MRRMVEAGSNGAPRPQATRVPHDPVNEQVLLVAAARDPALRARLVQQVPPDGFLVSEHVDLWLALTELERRHLDYSPETLRQLSGGKADTDYLEALCAARPALPVNVGHHVSMLEWDRVRAEAVKGPLTGLLEALRDPSAARERVQALAAGVVTTLERGASSGLVRDAVALGKSAMVGLRERRERACYPYGLPGLDMTDTGDRWRMVPGAAPGKVTVITGVPGSGKSTLAARIALAQAEAGRRVVYGAWEMGSESTLELLAAMRLGWSRYTMSTGALTDADEVALEAEFEWLQERIKFVEVPGHAPVAGTHVARGERAGNERALDQIHGVIASTAADVFVADLWKRCLRRTEPDEEEHALVRQQNICSTTKCHGILLQQQRLKDVEQRPDKRPTREGIKGTGAYVEIADTILGVHRAALWKAVDDVVLEIDVLKQRWGQWPIAIEFEWDSDRGGISGGTTVPYDAPSAGETSGDDFLAPRLAGARRPAQGRRRA